MKIRDSALDSALDSTLDSVLAEANRLEASGNRVGATSLLDAALAKNENAPAAPRFRASLLLAEMAVDAGHLIEARGRLAEALQIRLNAAERESLSAEARRADDLEAFLTHRGCAG
jgi:hypothetical protein